MLQKNNQYGFKRPAQIIPDLPGPIQSFGIRSLSQLARDLEVVLREATAGRGFKFGLESVRFIRPDLSLPAYFGQMPDHGLSPVYHLFDRVSGGQKFSQLVTRKTARDFRGGHLSYDDHDGVDFVCPPGTPLCAAAPGRVVLIRDSWLRGGLTVAVDHGRGLVTQYTHCARALVPVGTDVKRGQPVAASGVSGMDMTTFFPWVPPHIHFMVWDQGQPMDPFLAAGEDHLHGSWLNRNDPRPSGSLPDDRQPDLPEEEIDREVIEEMALQCRNEKIQREIEQAGRDLYQLAALLEDSLHHDRRDWPEHFHETPVRRITERADAPPVRLSLPLPVEDYRGCFMADAYGSGPPAK